MFALPGKAIPEMTYTASGGMLNPTHSHLHGPPVSVCQMTLL